MIDDPDRSGRHDLTADRLELLTVWIAAPDRWPLVCDPGIVAMI